MNRALYIPSDHPEEAAGRLTVYADGKGAFALAVALRGAVYPWKK